MFFSTEQRNEQFGHLPWYVNATTLILAAVFYLAFLIPLTRLSNVPEKKWRKMGTHA